MAGTPTFYIGTSNIVLPVANKQSFPEGFKNASWLTYYASIFNSLEVNSSFYKIPLAKTVARWASEVPDDFRFTFKMSRDITHDKSLVCNPQLIAHFMQTINHTDKKGALLIQFPAGIKCNPTYLNKLLAIVQAHNQGWDICVEFRNNSWYCDRVYHLLELYSAALVNHDMPGTLGLERDLWTDFAYIRFHGPKGDYKGTYELNILEQYAALIKYWLGENVTVYCYFNNTMGKAVFDALCLQELIDGSISYH